jgi:predicted enzyme related to lactoylglutathione lyase
MKFFLKKHFLMRYFFTKYLLNLSIFISITNYSFGQTQKQHPKGSYVDTLNRYYQQADLPLYVYFSHAPDVAATQISPDDNPVRKNEVKPIYLDGHGKHLIRHFDELHKNTENFAVYADGIAPKSTIFFHDAPTHLGKNGKRYYGKNLTISLSTKDEMSGIKDLFYAVNKAEYEGYTDKITINQEGENSLHFYAVDNVGNVEIPQISNFIVDLTAPSTYHHIVGVASNNIISVSTKIYLTSEDSISGVRNTYYRFDNETDKPYTGGVLPFSHLNDGEHTLYYYSIDYTANKEELKEYKFYLDKTAPIMSSDVLGDKFIVNDKVYFSGRTKLKLTAVDNKSGIKEVLYSIDNEDFKTYSDPFYLPNKAGNHIIRYYALDNMSNEGAGNRDAKFDEYRHNVSTVYVDLTGPALGNIFSGAKFQKGDTLFINAETKVRLIAEDPESGLQKITYTLDGSQEEITYTQPFSINKSGKHNVNYFGYDNVNNRNVANFTVIVDTEGPDIFYHFSVKPTRTENEIPVYPAYSALFLAATDWLTGFDHIRYSINGGKEQIYSGLIQGFEKGKEYTIKISATDKLGNSNSIDVKFKTEKF